MRRPELSRQTALAALAGIWLLHAGLTVYWLAANVTITGWDVPGHLVSSYAYLELLSEWTPRTPFQIMTLDGYRPPLFHLSSAAFVGLLGRSYDAATLVNLAYMAVLLGSVYGIGRRLWDRRVGLLAAVVVSLYPMLFAMTRLLYIDYALTALVALSVYFLLRSDGLHSRGWSLALGLSVGWGMLIKWSHIIFVLPPLLMILWASRRDEPLASPAARGAPLLASAAAAALAAGAVGLWYLPGLEAIQRTPLGLWVPVIAWVLVACALVLALAPSGRLTNLLLSGAVATAIASAWYLPQIGFFRTLLLVGYGKPWDAVWGFPYYLRVLVNEQLSPLFVVALAVAACAVIAGRRRLSRGDGESMAIMASWFLVPLIALSWPTTTVDSRYTMPLLPPLALFTAWGLLRLQGGLRRGLAVGLVVTLGLFQLAALSFDSLAWLSNDVKAQAPFLVEVGPLARGRHLQWPDSGPNAGGYWALPDLLDAVEADRAARGIGEADLGLLVNSPQINDSLCYYLMAEAKPEGKYEGIDVHSLARRDLLEGSSEEPSTYEGLFSMGYVILKEGSRWGLRPSAIQAMDRLEDEADPFYSAFRPLRSYELPDGDVVILFAAVDS